MNSRPLPRILLLAVIAVYIAIGVLYAVLTPTWQVPDEPAHYNYVRALAEGRGFPVIEPGDYDQDYLELLKSKHFPAELSVDEIEYEDHQPPLYYLLATPVYWLFGGAVLPLRLLSVLIGAGVLAVAFGAVRAIFPARPELALATTAFIAFIPQHVAMSAGVENDALAELAVGGTLWALVVYLGGGHERPWPIGLLLAAALLTKTMAYITPPVAVIAVGLRWRLERRTWKWAAGQLAWLLVPALAISAPWFTRNCTIYGWHDPFGLVRHDEVVAGQMRTSQFLALNGWAAYWKRALSFTFQSFWGQFGWMGVVLPARIYQTLVLLSVLVLAGFLWWTLDPRRPKLTPLQSASMLLLLVSCFLTALSFLWYNLTFLQHQGRYLFPALIPIGLAAALGLERWVSLLPRWAHPWAMAVLFAGLAALDVLCLFRYIMPALTMVAP